MTKIEQINVRYVPKELRSGVLYVSEEFSIAVHLCPCGCGSKIKTPLGQTEWKLKMTSDGPSLYPSVGNWQLSCQSHYWIRRGKIMWSNKWSPSQILAGRCVEEKRREHYYDSLYPQKQGGIKRLLRWLKELF